ncbi:RNA methyltransferase [Salinimicrobium marinum]|uniref:RNA methyltransferase n=1 Tax=Salinimicrobium marinum TaxID=680283 RepID=A0A918VVP0_9FLAO|nr:RNA methyltransferase [Salinimicrobium marinum]GHA27341.1 RNA methyltransferase [Salinimicrobium marinum]
MFSKSQYKLITSLAQKKYREKHGLFIAEGKKTIIELINSSLRLHSLFTTEDIFTAEKEKTYFLKEEELIKISRLSTAQTALAIFHVPEPSKPDLSDLIVALDGIRDPGNLGTIIRLCDWFGIENLVCSEDTVDCYNSKVVQATMGSIARVNILYINLSDFLNESATEVPVFGTFMEGENIYSENLPAKGILIFGNEANGIRPETAALVDKKLSIPRFGESGETESLNVATATAILLSEFRRRSLTGM